MVVYFAALDPMTLVRALPGNVAQGIIWGIMQSQLCSSAEA